MCVAIRELIQVLWEPYHHGGMLWDWSLSSEIWNALDARVPPLV